MKLLKSRHAMQIGCFFRIHRKKAALLLLFLLCSFNVFCQKHGALRIGYSRLDAFHVGYKFTLDKNTRWNAAIVGGYNLNAKNFNTGVLSLAVFRNPYSLCLPPRIKPEFMLRGMFTSHPAMRFWLLSPGVDLKCRIFTFSTGHLDAFAGGAMNMVLAHKRKSFDKFIWPHRFLANVGLRYEIGF